MSGIQCHASFTGVYPACDLSTLRLRRLNRTYFERNEKAARNIQEHSMRSGMVGFIRRRPLVAYFALAFAVSWVAWAPLIIFGSALLKVGVGVVLLVLGVFGPTAAAFLVAWTTEGRAGVDRLVSKVLLWRVGLRWYLLAGLGPVLIMLAATGLSVALNGSPTGEIQVVRILLLPSVFVSVFFFGPLEQEAGWRGYALPSLQQHHSALVSALVVGFAWGVWHIPLFWTPGAPQYSSIQGNSVAPLVIAVAVIYDTSLTILFAWLFNNTKGSLVIAFLFHTSIDTALLVPMLLGLTQGLLAGNSQIFLIFLALIFVWVAVVLVAAGPSRLSRRAGVRPAAAR